MADRLLSDDDIFGSASSGLLSDDDIFGTRTPPPGQGVDDWVGGVTEAPAGRRGRLGSAAASYAQGVGQVAAGLPKSLALLGAPDAKVFKTLDLIDRNRWVPEQIELGIGRYAPDPLNPLYMEYQEATPERRQQIRANLEGMVDEAVQSPLYETGRDIDQWFAANFPTNPEFQEEFWASKVPQALGSATGFLAAGALTRGALSPLGPAASYVAPAALGSAMNRAQQFEDALRSGAEIGTALEASELGALIGLSEAVPIGDMLNRLDKGTGGAVKRWFLRALRQGTEEAVQEAFSGIMNDAVAKGLYDPKRGIWTTDRAEEGAVGFTTGVILETLMSLVGGRRRGAQDTQDTQDQPIPEGAVPASDLFGEEVVTPARAQAQAATAPPTPEDIESPIPTDLIQQGKTAILEAEIEQSQPPVEVRTEDAATGANSETRIESTDQGAAIGLAGRIVETQRQAAEDRARIRGEERGDALPVRQVRPVGAEGASAVGADTTGAGAATAGGLAQPGGGAAPGPAPLRTDDLPGADQPGAAGPALTPELQALADRFPQDGPVISADDGILVRGPSQQIKDQYGSNAYPYVARTPGQLAPVYGRTAEEAREKARQARAGSAALTPAGETPTASWVIRNKETGEVVIETFDRRQVDALNTAKYEAVPVQQHLGELNTRLRAEREQPSPTVTPASEAVTRQPIRSVPVENAEDTAITASGREVPVRYAVVEAADLVTSQTDDLRTNAAYPAELQPRDRTRAVSQQQIQDIANRLNPRLLDRSARASDGAPIISADGVVESGNGRVLAIRRAYSQGQAEQYRDYLLQQGYNTAGMKQPVLVRIREGEMTPEDRQAFTREANERDTLGMSATERAMADAAALPDSLLDLYQGGDVDLAGNRDFVRGFIERVVGRNDQASMIAGDGSMSQEAIRRIEGALLAKAYGDADLVASLIESADTNIRAIGGALMDVSVSWAQMRAQAQQGTIDPSMDQTDHLLDAVRLVQRARRERRSLTEFVGQTDMLTGSSVHPVAEAFLRLMFRNTQSWTQPAGREKLANALRFYLDQADKAQPGVDLLGDTAPAPETLLETARDRQYAEDRQAAQQEDLLAQPAGRTGDRGAQVGREREGDQPGPAPARGEETPRAGEQGAGAEAVTATAAQHETVAREVMGSRFETTTADINAVNRQLGSDFEKAFVGDAENARHIADIVADENLQSAPISKIRLAISKHQRALEKAQADRVKRISGGRTRGAGAGGYNRDIGRIEDKIGAANQAIARLQAEIDRRDAGGSNEQGAGSSEATPERFPKTSALVNRLLSKAKETTEVVELDDGTFLKRSRVFTGKLRPNELATIERETGIRAGDITLNSSETSYSGITIGGKNVGDGNNVRVWLDTFEPQPSAPSARVEESQPSIVYSTYEPEASNISSRERGVSEPSEAAQFDLFAPSGVPDSTARAQSRDNFNIQYRQVEVGSFKVGLDTVLTPEDAAHVMAPLRKHAQESFLVLVTDKNGKILNLIRHTKGLKAESSVSPLEVAGAVASTEGSAVVWLGHNHPSGSTEPSNSDVRITERLIQAFDGLGVQVKGHIILPGGQAATLFTGRYDATRIPIRPALRARKQALTERVLRRKNLNQAPSILNDTDAKNFVSTLDEDSIVLLSNSHQVVGTIVMSPAEMKSLREGGRVRRILSALDTTNSAAAVIYTNDQEAAANLARFFKSVDSNYRVLDWISKRKGELVSDSASGGRTVMASGPFYSVRDGSAPTQEGGSPASIESLTADLSARLKQLGIADKVSLKLQERIQAVIDGKASEADGRYMNRLIEVSLSAPNKRFTLNHEVIHALRDLGLINDAEWRALVRAANADSDLMASIDRRYKDPALTADKKNEEAVADMFGRWSEDRQAKGFIRTAFRKIQSFLEALGNALRGNGFNSVDSIFRAIERGDVGRRPGIDTAAGVAAFSVDFGQPANYTFNESDYRPSVVSWAKGRWGEQVAPNGKPIWQNFVRWFGDSKAVDSRGRPLVVYHGSGERLDVIQPGYDEPGAWFTTNYQGAGSYARGDNPTVHEVFLSIRNPLVVDFSTLLRNEIVEIDGREFDNNVDIVRYAERSGFDGVHFPVGNFSEDSETWVAFDPAQIKSATDNTGTFDPNNPDIRYSLSDPRAVDPMAAGGAQARQQAANKWYESQPLDQVMRLPFHLFGGINERGEWNWGLSLSKKTANLIQNATFSEDGRFAWMNGVLEKARAGLLDRYGLDPAYVERERQRGLDERRIMAKVPEIMQALKDAKIGTAEAKVLQAVLTGEAVADADMARLAEPIRNAIDDMGAEAVQLGLLSAESFERNRGAYLHRVYLKHENDQGSLSRWVSRIASRQRRKIIGNQFKGRGLWIEVDPGRLFRNIPGFKEAERGRAVRGEKFRVLDKIEGEGQETLRGIDPRSRRRVLNRVFLPADAPVPENLMGYADRGLWEVRGDKAGKVVLWRDFTKAERESMGEIVDARYTIAKTYMQMAHDLAAGRFFKDIALNEDWSTGTEPRGNWKNAEEYNRFWADPEIEWVRVPDTKIPKSNTKRYGALAGRFVRAEIWRDLAELERMQKPGMWDAVLTQWKLNKALALDTPIPTPTGWTTMGAIKVGDTVFDEKGRPCTVLEVKDIQYGRPCFEVTFSDGTKIVADDEHWWFTRHRNRGDGVRTTKEIRETLTINHRGEAAHSIPVAGALDLPEADLPIPPYALGVWLGDGDKAGPRISIGGDDIEEMLRHLSEAGMFCSAPSKDKRNNVYNFTLLREPGKCIRGHDDSYRKPTNCGLCERLLKSAKAGEIDPPPIVNAPIGQRMEDLGVRGDKHIPAIYLRASASQRRELLMGLMDSDGCITTNGDCIFITSTPRLRDGFLELARSLGYKPTVRETMARLNGEDTALSWRIYFKAYADEPVAKLARKVSRLKPRPENGQRSTTRQIVSITPVSSVPVRCIAVSSPSHLYLAGDGMVPTHNTARSPVVHMNNILSNAVLMDLADVRLVDLARGIRSMIRQDQDYQEAVDNGAFGSDMVAVEIRKNTLQPLLEEIERDMQGGMDTFEARVGVLGKLADAIWSRAKNLDRKMTSLYQLEDEVFRMATYMRNRDRGMSPTEAALDARDQFLNYDIRAPWVNAARRSVLPFISYSYRAVPKVAQSIMLRPWKVAKLATLGYVANALAYMVAGGDEDEERRSLDETESGYTWIGAPRMIRMPYSDPYGNPVFLDVRRWIPAGDVFDMNQGHGAFAIPAPLQFGGPLMLGAELALNKQAFTGQEITNDRTDDWWDKTGKVADWAWKSWMPSAAWIPGSWYWERIGRAMTGARDPQGRPYSLASAIPSAFGVKLKPQDVQESFYWKGVEFDRIESELKAELRRLGRDLDRGMISRATFERREARILEKMENLGRERERTFSPR